MKRLFRRLRRANRFSRLIFFILSITYIISFIFFAKNIITLTGIETLIRYIALVFFVFYFFCYIVFSISKLTKRRYAKFYLLSLLTAVIIALFIICSLFIDLIVGKISSFRENDKILYTSYLITLKDTQLNAKSEIGMIDDVDNIEGNILAKEIIKKNNLNQKIVEYSDTKEDAFLTMLYDLYEKKIDGLFISSNYLTLYSGEQDLTGLANETKVVYQASKKFKNDNKLLANNKSLSEPFTVLVMGVDSEFDGLDANAAFNGDTLILATFNPHTYTATMLSIPRDTYVPIACKGNTQFKINSSAAYGTECVVETIQNLTDIDIDYFVKINFKGVVDLVEALDGVEVNVEKPDFASNQGFNCRGKVCEQNSDRRWGEYTVFIDPGIQKLNGEQALAYSRCRYLYAESDLARNRHQQDVIMAIANKAMKIKSYGQFKKILEAISENISTNMSTNQILSSYKIFKGMISKSNSTGSIIDIQRMKLETYSLPVNYGGRTLSALGYYEDSLEEITKAMKINLELEDPEIIKTFSYSLNENYVSNITGTGLTASASNKTMTSFVGKTKAEAEKYCSENNMDCSFTYVDSNSAYYDKNIETDLIANHKPSGGELLNDVNQVTFYINGKDDID